MAVERTAARAGLIAAGDLAASGKAIAEGGEGAYNVPVRERLRDLAIFAVSDEYLQMRQIVGSALVTEAPAAS
jgi:hypothetical protein